MLFAAVPHVMGGNERTKKQSDSNSPVILRHYLLVTSAGSALSRCFSSSSSDYICQNDADMFCNHKIFACSICQFPFWRVNKRKGSFEAWLHSSACLISAFSQPWGVMIWLLGQAFSPAVLLLLLLLCCGSGCGWHSAQFIVTVQHWHLHGLMWFNQGALLLHIILFSFSTGKYTWG